MIFIISNSLFLDDIEVHFKETFQNIFCPILQKFIIYYYILFQISWFKRSPADSVLMLLTVGDNTYIGDSRVSIVRPVLSMVSRSCWVRVRLISIPCRTGVFRYGVFSPTMAGSTSARQLNTHLGTT